MNKKEVSEIRRRMRRDRVNMRAIYGCYVRDNQEIISEFKAPMSMLPDNEADKYMALFKKTLGGSLGKTLNDICFSTKQVANREEKYATLFDLRKYYLDDQALRNKFYKSIIESLELKTNYVILLGCDIYDVPFKSKDDGFQSDASDETFTYIVCAICPVKETKSNLHYVHDESTFHDGGMMQAVSSPIAGFLFPAFDGRSTNLYGALYFNKDTTDSREAFVEAVFDVKAPRPADAEKRSFGALLTSALGEECSMEVVQAVHEQAAFRVQMHEESKVPDALTVNRDEMKSVLAATGASPEAVTRFGEAFDETFGSASDVNLENIVDVRHYTVTAPDVVIKVAPERAQDVEMRDIGGIKCIVIPVDGEVEVNGIPIA